MRGDFFLFRGNLRRSFRSLFMCLRGADAADRSCVEAFFSYGHSLDAENVSAALAVESWFYVRELTRVAGAARDAISAPRVLL